MGEYLVSAIVSTYNSERFMRGCLEDLEAQTIADRLELVVVDSHSAQNEGAIVREFQKDYDNIVYIRTDFTETTHAAFSRCVRNAHGKYMTLACTDDRHHPQALERMVTVLESRPDIALVYANSYITRTENETFDKHTRKDVYRWIDFDPLQLLSGCYMGPQPMWRRELHNRYGYFDARLQAAGDWDFWLRLAEHERFLHIDEFLGLYLYSEESSEHRNPGQTHREIQQVREKYAHRKPILEARQERARKRASAKEGLTVLIPRQAAQVPMLEDAVRGFRDSTAGMPAEVRIVRADSSVPDNTLGVSISPPTETLTEALHEAVTWQSRYVLLAAPSWRMPKKSLRELTRTMDMHPELGAISPGSVHDRAPNGKAWHFIQHPDPSCMLLRSKAVRASGGIDLNVSPSEALLRTILRLQDNGYRFAESAKAMAEQCDKLRAGSIFPRVEFIAHIATARAALAAGHFDTADKAIQHAIDMNPACTTTQLLDIERQRWQGDFAAAVSCLTTLLKTTGPDADALALLARLNLDLGKTENVPPIADSIRRLNPDHPIFGWLKRPLASRA